MGPHCRFCKTVNIPGSQLCVSCHRPVSVISYDSVVRELDGVKWALKKMIATEMDLDVSDPEERKRIDETFQRAIAPPGQNDYLGD